MAPEPATPRKQLSGGWLVLALIVAGVAGIAFAGRVFNNPTETRPAPQASGPHCYEPDERDFPWRKDATAPWRKHAQGKNELGVEELRFISQSCHEVRLEAGQVLAVVAPNAGAVTGWKALKGRIEINWYGSKSYLKRLPDGVLTTSSSPSLHNECNAFRFKATEPSTFVIWATGVERAGPGMPTATDHCSSVFRLRGEFVNIDDARSN
jgi:hypothetical protein